MTVARHGLCYRTVVASGADRSGTGSVGSRVAGDEVSAPRVAGRVLQPSTRFA